MCNSTPRRRYRATSEHATGGEVCTIFNCFEVSAEEVKGLAVAGVETRLVTDGIPLTGVELGGVDGKMTPGVLLRVQTVN